MFHFLYKKKKKPPNTSTIINSALSARLGPHRSVVSLVFWHPPQPQLFLCQRRRRVSHIRLITYHHHLPMCHTTPRGLGLTSTAIGEAHPSTTFRIYVPTTESSANLLTRLCAPSSPAWISESHPQPPPSMATWGQMRGRQASTVM